MPSAAGAGRGAGDGEPHAEKPEAREADAVADAAAEIAAGGTQHEALDAIAMSPPEQLGDGPAHRVADGEEPVDAENVGQRGDVVRTVGQAEAPGADAAPVAPMVEGDHSVVRAQRVVAGEPVETGGGA